MKHLMWAILITLAAASMAVSAEQTTNIPSEVTLFKNVKIFDGRNDELKEGLDVLVVKNKIHKIAATIPTTGSWEIDVNTGGVKQIKGPETGWGGYTFTTFEAAEKVTKKVKVNIIDGAGRTLMPGLIDSHTHLNGYKDGNIVTLESTTWEEIGARAAAFGACQ